MVCPAPAGVPIPLHPTVNSLIVQDGEAWLGLNPKSRPAELEAEIKMLRLEGCDDYDEESNA